MFGLILLTVLALAFIATAVYGISLMKQGNASLRRMVYDQRTSAQAEGVAASAFNRGLSARNREITKDELLTEMTKKRPPRILVTTANDLSIAGWAIPAPLWLALQFGSSGLAVIPLLTSRTLFVVIAIALLCPLILSTILRWQVKRRLKQFDRDYYAFLLVFVSMVRVGMNVVTGLREALKGLPEESLVRDEIESVLQALNLGIPEVMAFSQLGKRFYHPHLVSFRNAILVNRRFGGSLSEAVVRIASQNRKQHNLFDKVDAAIAMERGSIWLITVIMSLLLGFLSISNPELYATEGKLATYMWEGGMLMLVLGFIGIQRLSHIKV